ncbi:pseudouridine synthase [Cupriavidus basilensis]|uniref:Dual-specificity RNA pseudouridine synthase RluF n=1 Tax=Cupriavidus basilensis TaxID=68895 RepID=A0A0C4YA45_9BURK|nr:pseudouridine synthase [Cupriavidus basilensis]AJG19798.1 tRNA pseudouridine synthase A [Cupriavidus basilensis]
MTDSNSPKRKTLGIKTAAPEGNARKPAATRPVRVSDLNRGRVRAVVDGIKQAQERAGGRKKAEDAGQRPPRGPRPGEGQDRPRRFTPGEGQDRPRRFGGDSNDRPRNFGAGEGQDRPRRFNPGEGQDRPRRFTPGEGQDRPRRFGGDSNDRPRNFGSGEGQDRPRRFTPGEGQDRPRRFGGDSNDRPRNFGAGEGQDRPRRFTPGEGQDRPRRFGGDSNDRPRNFGAGEGQDRPRRFTPGEGQDRPRRFAGEGNDRPRRFAPGEGQDRPRRFGPGEGQDRPRRFAGEGNDRPRNFGPGDGNDRPRRFTPGEGQDRPRRFAGEGDDRPRRPAHGGDNDRARRAGDAGQRDYQGARAERTERTERAAPVQNAPQPSSDGLVRLSKRMSELGLCSRREADEWIPRGWVLVDGQPVTELGSRISPDANIEIHQAARSEQGERVTVLLHKPVGYVSGQAEDGYEPAAVLFAPENQWELDPTRKRFAPWQRKSLAPAGRLDIDSTGLLVLTQDGRVARHLIGEDSTVEKEYLVRVSWDSPEGLVERDISHVFPVELIEKLRHGLSLDGEALKPAKVSWQNEEQLRFVLREGKKRQIRRMCEQVGLRVVGLKRVRMGRIVLGDLPVGQWRFLGAFEKF